MPLWHRKPRVLQPALLNRRHQVFRPEVFDGSAFYCYYNECLAPQTLDHMRYGCVDCHPKRPLYKDLDKTVREKLPEKLTQIWTTRPLCLEHDLHPVQPYCAVCEHRIDEDGWHPPIGIWGGPSAGKTVFCAVLAQAIYAGTLFTHTGLVSQQLVDRTEYRRDVITPLFQRSGLLPAKTNQGEHRKLVLKVQGATPGDGWPVRTITLTDMAGEDFNPNNNEGHDEMLESRQRTVLFARESIFLANPEAAPGLGATTRIDLFPFLAHLLPSIQRALPGATRRAGERLLQVLTQVLSNNLDLLDAEASCDSLAQEIAYQLPHALPPPALEALIPAIRTALETVAGMMAEAPTLMDQLSDVVQLMSDGGYQRRAHDRKLAHRIAITVSKQDILAGSPQHPLSRLSMAYNDILKRDGLRIEHPAAPPRASVSTWRRALGDISQVSREALITSGEAAFVAFVESQFAEVGFFFVSSLGRDTEAFLCEDRIHAPAPQAAQAQNPFGPQAPLPQPAAQLGPAWVPGKRVALAPGRGGRTPEPRHVLLPLLWLLAGSAV